jgi:hypothetical protein
MPKVSKGFSGRRGSQEVLKGSFGMWSKCLTGKQIIRAGSFGLVPLPLLAYIVRTLYIPFGQMSFACMRFEWHSMNWFR